MQKIFYTSLVLVCMWVNAAKGQFIDDFSDGNFTANPAWSGNLELFTVNGLGQLQLNASVAGTSFLVTPLNATNLDNMEWNIRVRQNFAPSSTNLSRIYLASTNEVLTATSSINAYYLQLGETGTSDVVRLIRQNGSSITTITSGTFNISTAFHIDIKVTRHSGGVWNLFVKSITEANFGLAEATATDATFNSGDYFGIVCIYTVANIKNFFFDNITVTSPPDVSAPSITGISVNSATTLGLTFSENISITSAADVNNYDTEIGNPIATSAVANTVNLTFSGMFVPNTQYSLIINGITDLAGNTIATNTTLPFTFTGVPAANTSAGISFRQIVINEIMADPTTVLGNAEYMEMYNTTPQTLSLHNLMIFESGSYKSFPVSLSIPGNGYLVITNPNALNALKQSIPDKQVISLAGLNNGGWLTNGGERLILSVNGGNLIDSCTYTTAQKGVAWEQINPFFGESQFTNWALSNNTFGGTPGAQNSVFSTVTGSPGGGSTNSTFQFRQLVLNEIMPDPSPTLGLPNYEYLEIYNNSDTTVNLSNLILIESNTRRNFPQGLTLAGNGFLVICNSNALFELTEALPGKQVISLPGLSNSGWLTNGGETLILSAVGGNLIDSYSYTTAPKGYAWEQINPLSPCSGRNNWKISTNPVGGTPGEVNAVYNTLSDNPLIIHSRATLANQVLLVFNQPLDTLSFANATFRVDSNLTANWQYVRTRSTDSLYLNINNVLKIGRPYGFTVTGLKNCTGGEIANGIFKTGIGRLPLAKEVVINEIYADEDPSYGLPDGEFAELFNTTNDLIDISNFLFLDNTASSRGRLGNNVILQPNEYVILCSSSNAAKFEPYGRVAIVTNWPSLNSTNEVLRFANVSTVTIDQVSYTDKWYRDDTKKGGGYTLERINPFTDCGGRYNWMGSVNTIGGTPGTKNSVYNIDNDTDKPQLLNISLRDRFTLFLSFNKGLRSEFDVASASLSNKVVNDFQFFGADSDSLAIGINTPIDSGVVYTFSIKDVRDCSGNLLDFTAQTLGIGKKANANEIVINEIMADETPVVGLPEAEFVELYNTTDFLLDLSNYRFFDNSATPGRFPASAVIKPKGYVILCATSRVNDFKPYGDTYGLISFPSLNNSGESLTLRNANGERISQITYSSTWYNDQNKKDGGWTLERVDPLNPCGTANNWTASVDPTGGTPGKQNSVFANNPDQTAPKLLRAFAIAKDSLLLYFNEALDSISATSAPVLISDNVSVTQRIVGLEQILCILDQAIEAKKPYTVQITQVTDCSGNYIEGDNKQTFYLAEQPDSGGVIINEVLFNPRVGGNDFVEIYNRSKEYINLKNWKISNHNNDARTIITDNHLLKPNEYRVITNNVENIKNNYPNAVDSNFIQIPTMPSYPDAEGTVKILMNTGALTDVFEYQERFHLRLIDNKNGVSLERTSYELPTNTRENWASASQNVGFATPGYKNSQNTTLNFSDNSVEILPKVFTPDEDGVDDFCVINFNIKGINNLANITIFDMEGRVVRYLVRNVNISQQGFFQWDGSNEEGRKALIGNYLVWIEVFNPQGDVQRYKQNVVVGARF